jgi:glycosyltransferase involved in cell wall biosynthesis
VTSLSVVVSTYDRPAFLEKVLRGYAVQSDKDFELLVADDGSGPETAALIARARLSTGLSIVHVWHCHQGFRKSLILNRAIAAASGDYLVFTDGDCIPREDLVATHRRLARRGRYVAGVETHQITMAWCVLRCGYNHLGRLSGKQRIDVA